jgi:hypothetical protein
MFLGRKSWAGMLMWLLSVSLMILDRFFNPCELWMPHLYKMGKNNTFSFQGYCED